VPERHTEFFEVGVGHLREDVGVNFTRAKERLVLSEAETSEPTPDIHVHAPRAPERIILRLKRSVQGRAVEGLGWVTMAQRHCRSQGRVWGRKSRSRRED
jgi:hypothetical protein